MSFLPPFGKSLTVFRRSETSLGPKNHLFKSSWQGRMVSTRPTSCSEKCKYFNPKTICCKPNDDIDEFINPMYSWHPLNIYHDFNYGYLLAMRTSFMTKRSEEKPTSSNIVKTSDLANTHDLETINNDSDDNGSSD